MTDIKTLTLEEVRARHPLLVQEAEATLRKSRSKQRTAPLESITWGYGIAVRIDSKPELEGVEAQVADLVSRTSTCLEATVGRWVHRMSVQPAPPEVAAWHRRNLEEDEAEQRRLDAQTPEESEAEIQGLLKQLRRSPGFIEL